MVNTNPKYEPLTMGLRSFAVIINNVLLLVYCVLAQVGYYNDELISQGKRVEMTSRLNYAGDWRAAFAVDGNLTTTPDTCGGCCACSNGGQNDTFTLNLEKKYVITRIIIYGRSKGTNAPLRGFKVYLSDTKNYQNGKLVHRIEDDKFENITIADEHEYQFVTVRTDGAKFLLICELQVFAAACSIGYFGFGCSKRCNCFDNKACDFTSGICQTPICKAGWHGAACDKPCSIGYFGFGCSKRCNCFDNKACDFTSGICQTPICKAGWHGAACDKPCDDYNFGQNCSSTCHCLSNDTCDNVDGHCPNGLCAAGWKGSSCDEVCNNGSFGLNCSYVCHCRDNASCDHIYGVCVNNLCSAGWQGDSCDKVCNHGSFGLNCSSVCHCQSNASCDNINGVCVNNLCSAGWQGESCDKVCNHGSFGLNCSSACHCQSNASCDKINGVCVNNLCSAGWQGDSCDKVCNHGSFGLNCSSTCNCLANASCNHMTGVCNNNLCSAGWQGESCDEVCSHASFGLNCSSVCNCLANASCSHVTGVCDNNLCSVGWRGDSCNEVCSHPMFGLNCSSACNCLANASCDHVNGVCDNNLCSAGWRENSCDKVCSHASFGLNCSSVCNCLANASCDHVTGVCENNLCSAGWQENSCDKECSHASFGLNCSSVCNCLANASCDHVTGVCDNNLCSAGWRENSCNKECTNKTFGENCSQTCNCVNECHHIHGNCTLGGCLDGWQGSSCTVQREAQAEDNPSPGPIIGGVIASFILCAVVVAVLFMLRRRARHNDKSNEGELAFKNENELKTGRKKQTDAFSGKGLNTHPDDSTCDQEQIYTNESSQGIKIHELWNYIKLKSQKKSNDFVEEYKSVPKKFDKPSSAAVLPANIGKNRYREMHPYDENRVQLTKTEAGESDYINASYIDGVNFKRKFIASQGPQQYMVDDFWRMIWNKKARKVIMLTNVYDNDGSRKIVQYWSDESSIEYGKLSINVLQCVTTEDYDIRDMRITHEDGSTHDIRHFHFKSWPDKDVPSTTWSLVHFWRVVNEIKAPEQPGKIVVHCSAGVGRTGTYIALDILYNEAILYGEIKPVEMLRRLREQRICMVQTKEQYVFLHEALAEAVHFGTQHALQSQFEDIFTYMMGNFDKSSKSRLQDQYELILKSLDHPLPGKTAEELYGNTGSVQSEINAYKPSSGTWNSDVYPDSGAVILPLYTGENGFIICKLPSDSKIHEFWKMVQERNVKTVVLIHELSKYRSPESKVKLFEMTSWRKRQPAPKAPSEVLSFLESIIEWQPRVTVAQPIIVCCNDGATQSGLLCVLLNELYRVKDTNGHINIVESVKTMKHRNRKIIADFPQYKFCYEVIREACIQTNDAAGTHDLTYENEQLYQNVSTT